MATYLQQLSSWFLPKPCTHTPDYESTLHQGTHHRLTEWYSGASNKDLPLEVAQQPWCCLRSSKRQLAQQVHNWAAELFRDISNAVHLGQVSIDTTIDDCGDRAVVQLVALELHNRYDVILKILEVSEVNDEGQSGNTLRSARVRVSCSLDNIKVNNKPILPTLSLPVQLTTEAPDLPMLTSREKAQLAAYRSSKLTDHIFVVARRRFPVHRLILLGASDYFKLLFDGALPSSGAASETSLEDISARTFNQVLEFIYARTTIHHNTASQWLDLFVAADRFRLDALKLHARDSLFDLLCQRPNEVIPVMEWLLLHNDELIEEAIFVFLQLDQGYCAKADWQHVQQLVNIANRTQDGGLGDLIAHQLARRLESTDTPTSTLSRTYALARTNQAISDGMAKLLRLCRWYETTMTSTYLYSNINELFSDVREAVDERDTVRMEVICELLSVCMKRSKYRSRWWAAAVRIVECYSFQYPPFRVLVATCCREKNVHPCVSDEWEHARSNPHYLAGLETDNLIVLLRLAREVKVRTVEQAVIAELRNERFDSERARVNDAIRYQGRMVRSPSQEQLGHPINFGLMAAAFPHTPYFGLLHGIFNMGTLYPQLQFVKRYRNEGNNANSSGERVPSPDLSGDEQ